MAGSNNTEKSEIGNRYVDWIVLRKLSTYIYMCICEPCGKARDVDIRDMRRGKSTGCGCQRKARATKRKMKEALARFAHEEEAAFEAAVDAEFARVQAQEEVDGVRMHIRVPREIIKRRMEREWLHDGRITRQTHHDS